MVYTETTVYNEVLTFHEILIHRFTKNAKLFSHQDQKFQENAKKLYQTRTKNNKYLHKTAFLKLTNVCMPYLLHKKVIQ